MGGWDDGGHGMRNITYMIYVNWAIGIEEERTEVVSYVKYQCNGIDHINNGYQ